jgi:hypothetical protein
MFFRDAKVFEELGVVGVMDDDFVVGGERARSGKAIPKAGADEGRDPGLDGDFGRHVWKLDAEEVALDSDWAIFCAGGKELEAEGEAGAVVAVKIKGRCGEGLRMERAFKAVARGEEEL